MGIRRLPICTKDTYRTNATPTALVVKSRPPSRAAKHLGHGSQANMQITVAPKSPSIHALQVAAALVILGSLCLLAGCQGVSAGNKSSNQQSSTLSLASATL